MSWRKKILDFATPLSIFIGRCHAPWSKKKLRSRHVHFIQHLPAGTVLLTKTYGELTNFLIPGALKHGAIYDGEGNVIEAVGAGVVHTDLIDFVMSKDELVVVRPLFCENDAMARAVQWAKGQIGQRYDYAFMSNNDAFYCFELTFAAYQEALGGQSPWTLRETWGEPTVVADDFLKASKKWVVVFDSRGS